VPLVPPRRDADPSSKQPELQLITTLHARLKDLVIVRQRSTVHCLPRALERVNLGAKRLSRFIDAAKEGHDALSTHYSAILEGIRTIDLRGAAGVAALCQEVGTHRDRLAAAVHSKTTADVKEWSLKALAGGAGAAHKWVRKADLEHEPSPVPGDPLEDAERQQQAWAPYWTRGTLNTTRDYIDAMARLRPKAARRASELPPLTPKVLRAANAAFKPHRGRGFDYWDPDEMRYLPEPAWQELCDLYHEMELALTPPFLFLLNLIVMLPKPAGGYRPIALLAYLYALWGKARRADVQAWDVQRAGHWDNAIAGSSALHAALRRRLLDEVALAHDEATATLLWDQEKFYDTLSWDLLVRFAIDLDYPPTLLYIGLQVHAAPRILRTATGCHSSGLNVSSSILAGDGQSNSWARAFLHQLLQDVHDAFMPTTVNQFVDDLCQRDEDPDEERVRQRMGDTAGFLFEGLEGLRLTVSKKKTKVIASSARLREGIAKDLADRGRVVHTAVADKDLGIGANASRRREAATTSIRQHKVAARAKRGAKLNLWSGGKAKKIYTAGLAPAACYGVEANGATDSRIAQLRAIAVKLAPASGTSPCTTTTIALGIGQQWDPAIRIRSQIVETWLSLWQGLSKRERARVRHTWAKALDKFTRINASYRWRSVNGPVATAVVTLLDISWVPVKPDRWIDDLGTVWQYDLGNDTEVVVRAVRDSASRRVWAKASRYRNGSGAEEGVDLQPLKKGPAPTAGQKGRRCARHTHRHRRGRVLATWPGGGGVPRRKRTVPAMWAPQRGRIPPGVVLSMQRVRQPQGAGRVFQPRRGGSGRRAPAPLLLAQRHRARILDQGCPAGASR